MRSIAALKLAVAIAAALPVTNAVAGDWELEIHGGGLWTFVPSSGLSTSPPPGVAFQTIVPEVSSRRVTSWFYGDGGSLLAQRVERPVSTGNFTIRSVRTVGNLDAVLSSAAARWPFGGVLGARLGRRLGSRLSAELNVEYSPRGPVLSDEAREDVESSRAAFESTWGRTLAGMAQPSVTAQADVREGGGGRLLATAVLNVNLETGDAPDWSRRSPSRRFVSYLSFGAGIDSASDGEASATLVGRYRFASPFSEPGAPFEETDTVTVRSGTPGTAFVGVFGFGAKQDLSARWGLRIDARAYLGANRSRTRLHAGPSVTPGSPPAALVTVSRAGAIQFVNQGPAAGAGEASSLSGPPVAGLQTFEGSGVQVQLNVSLGVFLRF